MLCDEMRHVLQAAANKRGARLPPTAISVNVAGGLQPSIISPSASQTLPHQVQTPASLVAAPSPYSLVVPPPPDGVTPVKPRGGRGRKSSKNVSLLKKAY